MYGNIYIVPFSINVALAEIGDLRGRLPDMRWPDPIVHDWSDGTDPSNLRDLIAYWRENYNWHLEEATLRPATVFRAHRGPARTFLHVRGKGPKPLPLIVSHGWPGSFIEMLDLIPRLTDPERFGGDPADSFDVVVPSLPGYGFPKHPQDPAPPPSRSQIRGRT